MSCKIVCLKVLSPFTWWIVLLMQIRITSFLTFCFPVIYHMSKRSSMIYMLHWPFYQMILIDSFSLMFFFYVCYCRSVSQLLCPVVSLAKLVHFNFICFFLSFCFFLVSSNEDYYSIIMSFYDRLHIIRFKLFRWYIPVFPLLTQYFPSFENEKLLKIK